MKVSLITVCYNSERFIATAIDSVLSQVYEDIEYIIVDGKSSDGTLDIIKSYNGKIDKLVSEPDRGIYDAMNKGISLATGDIIGILNSDDFYLNSNVILNVVETFKSNPSADIVLGNVDFVKPDNLDLPVRFYSSFYFNSWKMRFGFMPAHPSAFIKSSAYQKVGFYSTDYKTGADFEWFVRALILHKLIYIKLNKTMVRMREGGATTSGIKSYWLSSKEQNQALKNNYIYTNLFFILARLPIKFYQKVIGAWKFKSS